MFVFLKEDLEPNTIVLVALRSFQKEDPELKVSLGYKVNLSHFSSLQKPYWTRGKKREGATQVPIFVGE